MLFLQKPERERVEKLVKQEENEPFTYPEVGGTKSNFPSGYSIIRERILLGKGEAVFEKAKQTLNAWKMFDLSWVTLYAAKDPPSVGDAECHEGLGSGFSISLASSCRTTKPRRNTHSLPTHAPPS
jgi:uncharacterized protein (UPF0548 family)